MDFESENLFTISAGVADGVGGWRSYGVDPSQFPCSLMATCERMVKLGKFSPQNPVDILASSYQELLQAKEPLVGQYFVLYFSDQSCSLFLFVSVL